MKKLLILLCTITSTFIALAQDDPCIEKLFAKKGNWQLRYDARNAVADYAMQKKFTDAAHAMVNSYQPLGVELKYGSEHVPRLAGIVLNQYLYLLGAFEYICHGDKPLSLEVETSNWFRVAINSDFNGHLYEEDTDVEGTGYRVLREGIPEEIKPGVWQFKDVNLLFGLEKPGRSKIWLMTYPGQLPWNYVTRKAFLINRKRLLQNLKKEEDERLQQNLAELERQKKDVQSVTKNDPAQYAAYLKNDYEPAPKRFKENHDKTVADIYRAIERVEEQLQAPEDELSRRAIVIKSVKNYLDYDFTDNWQDQFAEVLVTKNPTYIKPNLPLSIPQFIAVSLEYYPPDTLSAAFANNIAQLVDPVYLQTWIGKTAPTGLPASLPAQPVKSGNASTKVVPVASKQAATASNKSNDGAAKTSTPQASLSKQPTYLSGTLSAPAGVPVTIGYGSNEITLTPAKAKYNLYSTVPIHFAQPVKDGEAFNVMVKKMAGNMKAVVYKGSGKVPDDASSIKIGVDYKYELVTRSNDDNAFSGFYESSTPCIGGINGEEGRYVAFVSWTQGFAGNDGKYRQVFWRDRNTGITRLISATANGQPGNGDSELPSMSADGQTVVFESKASNLVSGDNNALKDVFIWRAQTNSIELVSKTQSGDWSNGNSYDAMVSGNGAFVVFTSDADNMTGIPKGRSLYNVFLRDMVSDKTELLSIDPVMKTGATAVKASVSYYGNRVSFCSPSPNLVANDNNNLWDIFLWEKDKPGLQRISLTQDGKERNQGDESASRQVASTLSGNGRYIVYSTTASNMVPGDNLLYQDVFVYDITTGKLQVASFSADNQPGNHDSPIEQGERIAISHDGTWIAFTTKASNLGVPSSNVVLFNTQTGIKQAVSETKGSYVGRPAISYSGSYVLFGKSEPLDQRSGAAFGGSGLFAYFTGNGPCRDCK